MLASLLFFASDHRDDVDVSSFDVVGLLIALLAAAIVFFVLRWILGEAGAGRAAQVVSALVAVLVFLVVAFS